jgi:hypothetical protein
MIPWTDFDRAHGGVRPGFPIVAGKLEPAPQDATMTIATFAIRLRLSRVMRHNAETPL